MATQGNLREPFTLASLDLLRPIPVGDLLSLAESTSVDHISAIISGRFPTPPIASGFLTDMEEFELILPGPRITTHVFGILAPCGDILEPTIGQIWPR